MQQQNIILTLQTKTSLEITMAANQPNGAGGWYNNEFLPWIQNQDLRKSFGYGIGFGLFLGITNSFGHLVELLIALFLIFAFSTWMDELLFLFQNQDLRRSFGYGICIGLFLGYMNNWIQNQYLLLFLIFAFSTLF